MNTCVVLNNPTGWITSRSRSRRPVIAEVAAVWKALGVCIEYHVSLPGAANIRGTERGPCSF